MDLGCLDLGCISLCDEKQNTNSCAESLSSNNSSESLSSITKLGRKDKDSPPLGVSAINRVSSQIKKPLHRKTSPLNWFPRIKGDSYMKRKIKLLQEAGGMNTTLDETLGHSNPHYCRVEREKRAAREAACKVMEARKAAMIEASWCRILQAARISHKEADALLQIAEKEVADAFEAATAKGVTMYDTPDRPLKRFEIQISSATGKGSTTHTVRASFETGFEVDKQVAAAVKTAFTRLAHSTSFNKDEFKDLLRKISENPDTQNLSSEYDTGAEFETISLENGSSSQRRNRKKLSPQKFSGTKLVLMMLERLKCLKEEELASLATIVATCGLNAALADTGSHRMEDKNAATDMNYLMNRGARQKQVEPELPSLEKFLVKKMTKLEKEVQEAKNARKAESKRDGDGKLNNPQVSNGNIDDKRFSVDTVPDLGSVLVKNSSKFEKEMEEAKKSQKLSDLESRRTLKDGKCRQLKQEVAEVPSLDQILIKHVSRLEKEVQEAKKWRQNDFHITSGTGKSSILSSQSQKENINSNTESYKKHNEGESESLDKILVKHVSKLEKEKMEFGSKEVKKKVTEPLKEPSGGGLDQILIKHKSRLEREKSAALEQAEDRYTYSKSRREARERELLDTWGGIGLSHSIRPHVSRLERDKAAWLKAEEEEKQAAAHEQSLV
ncbi:hypothetical protein SOVF_194590 isoform B [Spinacia oleracea]|uniref:Uncharacterized protein isoform X2 n=1 Tax=Spinacia oleracea TaxID=3562 RepID=A0A9R0J3C0_SPIOL|nr:uncharacterized protein LOC110799645 isoform X2 [Spinacia oleracea]KNA04984.1 hypothetical protein SOVF_194590 isoform B [Spinacia oleracea]